MKAIYDREGLFSAFQMMSSVVPSRSPKPILTNVKIIAGEDRTVLMATDLEAVGIRYEVRGVKTEQSGQALLPMSRFSSILRELPDQEILIEADEGSCLVKGEHSEFELPGEDPAQYPDVPDFDGSNHHQVQAGLLKEMIARTVFSAAQENARYALTGVLWELSPEKVRLVATDGRRLAVADSLGIMHGKHATDNQTPVVPTKVMNLLERNLIDAEESVFVSLRTNDALFKTSRAVIYGRLVEGRYPPYREVFPKKTGTKVRLPVAAFLSAVRQAAILTDEDSRGVDFSFGKSKLTLKARVADKGRAKIDLAVEMEGKGLDMTFDPRYVADMLRVLDASGEVSVELSDANSAALFKYSDDYSYIVMPLTRETRSASEE